MAREIIREESDQLGDRSRLWIPSEVYDVLNKNKVTQAVEVLVLLLEKSSQKLHIDYKSFARMNNLRILKICDLELENFRPASESKLPKDSKVNFYGSVEFLSNDLRLLYWHGYPMKFLPSNFYPENIVAIDLSYSRIQKLWRKPKHFPKLKLMKLKHCHNLKCSPDFTGIKNLEELILEGCVNLVKVHPSIGMLKRLLVLNMKNCTRLKSFPSKMNTNSLQVLNLFGCLNVEKLLNEVFSTINTLVELHVDQTAITTFPYLFSTLTNLHVLSLDRHRVIKSGRWTSVFWSCYVQRKQQQPQGLALSYLASLRFLTRLNASDCNISEVSPHIGGLLCLEALKLSRNNFTCLPESLSQLSRLKYLILDDCKQLEELSELPCSIISFHASFCTSLRRLGNLLDIRNQRMFLVGCPKLNENVKSLMSMLQPQGLNSLSEELDILFYQKRIPQWFTYRSMGNHIKAELPQGWCYNKFRGYETYVILRIKKSYRRKANYGHPVYTVNNFDNAFLDHARIRPVHLVNDIMLTKIGSYVTWFHYTTSKPSWARAKNFVTLSFRGFGNIEVMECGVRLISEEETGLNMMHGLLAPTQDGGLFHLTQNWNSATIEDEPPHCTRHILWSSD